MPTTYAETFEDLPELNFITEEGDFHIDITHAKFVVDGDKREFKLTCTDRVSGLSVIEHLSMIKEAKWRREQVLRAIGFRFPAKGEKMSYNEDTFEGGDAIVQVRRNKWTDKKTGEAKENLRIQRWSKPALDTDGAALVEKSKTPADAISLD